MNYLAFLVVLPLVAAVAMVATALPWALGILTGRPAARRAHRIAAWATWSLASLIALVSAPGAGEHAIAATFAVAMYLVACGAAYRIGADQRAQIARARHTRALRRESELAALHARYYQQDAR